MRQEIWVCYPEYNDKEEIRNQEKDHLLQYEETRNIVYNWDHMEVVLVNNFLRQLYAVSKTGLRVCVRVWWTIPL